MSLPVHDLLAKAVPTFADHDLERFGVARDRELCFGGDGGEWWRTP